MVERLLKLLPLSMFELPSNLIDVIEDQFYQKWNILTTDLHYLLGEICLHDDANAIRILFVSNSQC
jgi:hypothetical protein